MPLPDNLALGRVLRNHRKASGFSQERLAELADLTANYVGELERGRKSPTMTTLRRLAKALNIPTSDLVREAEEAAQSAPANPGR